MVTLNKIYTKTGDDGSTGLATGARVPKDHIRVEAYGTVDEANSVIGHVRLALKGSLDAATLDPMLARIQNELFDLGADLATPESDQPLGWEPLRITPEQVTRLETDIDRLNADLEPLKSFVLPAGSPGSTHLHIARTVVRRAERVVTTLKQVPDERVSDAAYLYLNRLSDLLFVAARWANDRGRADVLWVPGSTR